MLNKKLSAFATVVATFVMTLAPMATRAAVTGAFAPGDLIRGSAVSTVYYFAPDGKRYVFPNEKTYFTWYTDFSKVKLISDGQLGTIPLGRSNVTYRPGYKMIKITTDPRTYAVDQGGVLRHIKSEELAKTLFGLNWQDRVDDLPDPFFINYKVGTAVEMAAEYKTSDVLNATPNISIDKQFDEKAMTITIGNASNGFVPTTGTIKVGTTVTWTNADVVPHTVSSASFNSGTIEPGKTYVRTFNTAGSFDYKCDIHTVMQGTVNVVN
ncbi:MAG: plastocyanin/azurin family copper-binding protein [Patescibacteria group bacterium]